MRKKIEFAEMKIIMAEDVIATSDLYEDYKDASADDEGEEDEGDEEGAEEGEEGGGEYY